MIYIYPTNVITESTTPLELPISELQQFIDNPPPSFKIAKTGVSLSTDQKQEYKLSHAVLATHKLDSTGAYDEGKVDFSPHYMVLDLDCKHHGFIDDNYPTSKAKEHILSIFGDNIIRMNETLSGGLHILVKTGYSQDIYKTYNISRKDYAIALVNYVEDELMVDDEQGFPRSIITFDAKSVQPSQRFMLYADENQYFNSSATDLTLPDVYLSAYVDTFQLGRDTFSKPNQFVEKKGDTRSLNDLVANIERRCNEYDIQLFDDRADWVRMSFSLYSAGGDFQLFKRLSALSSKEKQANHRTLSSHWRSIERNFDRSKSPSVSYLIQTAISIGCEIPAPYEKKKYTKYQLVEVLTTVFNKNYIFGKADDSDIYDENGDWVNIEDEVTRLESIIRNQLTIKGVSKLNIETDIKYIADVNRNNGLTFDEREAYNNLFRELPFYQNIPTFEFTQEGLLNHPYVKEFKELFNGFTELEQWMYIRMLFSTVHNYNRTSDVEEVAPDMYIFHGDENGGKSRLINTTFLPFTKSISAHRYGKNMKVPLRFFQPSANNKNEFYINRMKAQSYILFDDELYYWNSIRHNSAECKQLLSQGSVPYQLKGQNSVFHSVRNYTYVATTNVEGVTFDRSSQRRYYKLDFDYRKCNWRYDINNYNDTNDDIIWKLWCLVVYCNDNGFGFMSVKDWFENEIRQMQRGQKMESDEETLLKDALVWDSSVNGVRSSDIKMMLHEHSLYYAKNLKVSNRSITSILTTWLKESDLNEDIYTTNKSGSKGFRLRLRNDSDNTWDENEINIKQTVHLTDRSLLDEFDEFFDVEKE